MSGPSIKAIWIKRAKRGPMDAVQQADAIAESYILAYRGQVYGQAQHWPQAEASTEQALQRTKAPEMVYQWAAFAKYRAIELGRSQPTVPPSMLCRQLKLT